MKFKSMLTVLVLATLASSCLRVKNGYSSDFNGKNGQKPKALQAECKAMRDDEEIKPYLDHIDKDIETLLKLGSEHKDGTGHGFNWNEDSLDAYNEIADSIRRYSIQIYHMVDMKAIEDKYKYNLKWEIDQNDFKDPTGNNFKNGFEIVDVKIDSSYYVGMEMTYEMKDDISISNYGTSSLVDYHEDKGRSINICMLNRTVGIIVNVTYKAGDILKTEKLLLNPFASAEDLGY